MPTAGNVNATLVGGVLTLTSPVATTAEDLTLTPSISGVPGIINVAGNNGTQIVFAGATTPAKDFAGVHSIIFNLSGGDDTVAIQNGLQLSGNLTFNGGSADTVGNQLTLSNGTIIGGTVTIMAGAGLAGATNNISIGSLFIGRNLSVSFGSGQQTNSLTIGAALIGGSLSVVGGADTDQVTVTSATIGTSTSVVLGAGANSFTMNTSHIGSSLVVSGGAGSDTDLVQNSSVGTLVSAAIGDGLNSFTLAGTTIGTAVAVSAGIGNDTVLVQNCTVGTSVSTFLSAGDDTCTLGSSTVGTSVSVSAGRGNDTCSLHNAVVGGSVSVTMSDGVDIVNAQDLRISGGFSVALGNGNNTLNLDANGTGNSGSLVQGNLMVTGGSGVDTVSIGKDNPVVIGGVTTMALGAEIGPGDTVNIDDTVFLSAVSIDLGLGAATDQLLVEQNTAAANANTTFAEKLTVHAGDGNDTVKLGVAADNTKRVLCRVTSLLDGGLGTDSLSVANYFIGIQPIGPSSAAAIAAINFESVT